MALQNRQIRAAVVRQKGGPFTVERVQIAPPRAGEVLVKMAAVGICHSDVACRDQVFPARLPQVFGHEGAGVVTQLGEGVTGLREGDHIVLSFASCGHCPNCDGDRPAACDHFDQLNANGQRPDGSSALSDGQGLIHGHFFGQSSFAEYAVVSARNAVVIEPTIDLTMAAPFGCAVQTGAGCVINALQARAGHSILIIGVGSVGLSAVMAAKIQGCDPIITIDLFDARLQLSRVLGASHTFNANDPALLDGIRAICPRGVDFTVECSGSSQVQELALDALTSTGTCALLGVPGIGARFDVPCYAINRGRTVKGVVAGDSNPQSFLPRLLAHFQAGQLPVQRWVTHYRFDDINQAVADMEQGVTVKPVLVFD